jgi:hypothetical protein
MTNNSSYNYLLKIKRFSLSYTNPIEFDISALQYLRNKYSDLIEISLQMLRDEFFIDSELIENEFQKNLDWEVIERFILSEFIVAECLNLLSPHTLRLCAWYIKYRVIPISVFNKTLDLSYNKTDSYESYKLALNAGLLNLSSQLNGFITISNLENGLKFWNIHAMMLSRVVNCAYEEYLRRFDIECLKSPARLLNIYDGDKSPLLRSSVIETLFLALSAVNGYLIKSITWLQNFEKLRQTLDDLADMREDILNGRLTYTWLYALKQLGPNSKLEKNLIELWRQVRTNISDLEKMEYAENAIKLVNESDVYAHIEKIITKMIIDIELGIRNEMLPGNIEGLLILVKLKEAYFQRLKVLKFIDKKPELVHKF